MSDRVETGPLRFGEDWAGVFLRGDYAGPMAFYLNKLLEAAGSGKAPSVNVMLPLRGLASVLAQSDERGSLDGLQQLPDFALCKALDRRIEALETLAAEKEADVARLKEKGEYAAAVEKDGAARALRDAVKILRGET